MVFQIGRLRRRIFEILDENRDQDDFLGEGDVDTLSLHDITEGVIESAARICVARAPLGMLEHGHLLRGEVRDLSCGHPSAGWLLLPDDYLRLISFKGDRWQRSVNVPITTADGLYLLQSCGVAGVGGTVEKPVLAETMRSEGKALELFPRCGEYVGTYQPVPKVDMATGAIDIPERLKEAVCWIAAGEVAATLGAESEKYFTIAKTMMEQ